jgi:hypothetical protein
MPRYFNNEWYRFLELVEEAKDKLGFQDNEECFFRGHTNREHTLLPGLFRYPSGLFSPKQFWEIEGDMFYEFRARAKEVHAGNITDWDILFYMQHHGAKTRLLDWTESLGVALYFALVNYNLETSTPTIWLLNPYKLNKKYFGHRDLWAPENLDKYDEDEEEYLSYSQYLLYGNNRKIWWEQPLAIYPIRRVDRLTTQGGYFTIHGRDMRPIEDIIDESEEIYQKIELSKDVVESAFLFLDYSGIHDFTMFPDLDGLAKYLNKKYFHS